MKAFKSVSIALFIVPFTLALAHADERIFPASGPRENDLQKNAVHMALDESVGETPIFDLGSVSYKDTSWISGSQLLAREKRALSDFDNAAAGFRHLPDEYQLDAVASGIGSYNYFGVALNGGGGKSFENFKPTVELLAPKLNAYVSHIADMLEHYRTKVGNRISHNGLVKLVELTQIAAELKAGTDGAKTPYSEHINNLINLIRQHMARNSCMVSSAQVGFFDMSEEIKKRIDDSLTLPVDDLEKTRREAHLREDRFYRSLNVLTIEWRELMRDEKLDQFDLDAPIPLGSKNLASETGTLMNITDSIISEMSRDFVNNDKELVELLEGLKSGKLCIQQNVTRQPQGLRAKATPEAGISQAANSESIAAPAVVVK